MGRAYGVTGLSAFCLLSLGNACVPLVFNASLFAEEIAHEARFGVSGPERIGICAVRWIFFSFFAHLSCWHDCAVGVRPLLARMQMLEVGLQCLSLQE